MTLQVFLLQLTCPRDQRARSIQFQPTCNLCRGSHKSQAIQRAICNSFLSLCQSAPSTSEIKDLGTCLDDIKLDIEKSSAMLYTPTVIDLNDTCKHMVLCCYMLELMVIHLEEQIEDDKMQCIYHLNRTLSPEVGCPPCEIHSLQNSKTFFINLKDILQKLLVMSQDE